MQHKVPSSNRQQRVAALQSHLSSKSLALITHPEDILYFTGFRVLVLLELEALLIVTKQAVQLICSSFSPQPDPDGFTVLNGTSQKNILRTLSDQVQSADTQTIYLDEQYTPYCIYKTAAQVAETQDITITPLDRSIIAQLRMKKDKQEVRALQQAGSLTYQVMQQALENLTEGATEHNIQSYIDSEIRKHGGQNAFPTIVAFGEHAALPHHQPTKKKLRTNMPVLIDMGAQVDGYCSDMTRTVWFGETPSALFSQLESIVQTAYTHAVEALHNKNTTAQAVDAACRDYISEKGYGNEFIHTTGHGLGIGIHEAPSLNWSNSQTLEPGMAITIEPGIYLPGKLGYRFENTLLLTKSGATTLTLL